jgi:chaperonin cofactor prefoldin
MNSETETIQISLYDWQEMQRRIADLEQKLQRVDCQILALNDELKNTDTELSELEQILKNNEPAAYRIVITRWLKTLFSRFLKNRT